MYKSNLVTCDMMVGSVLSLEDGFQVLTHFHLLFD